MKQEDKIKQLELLHPRWVAAYKLRKQGLTFREVAEKLGNKAARARQLYIRACWFIEAEPRWDDGLSVRVQNVLCNAGVTGRAEALEFYHRPDWKWVRNYGWKSRQELAVWLGLPKPLPPGSHVNVPNMCPHCGRKLIESKP